MRPWSCSIRWAGRARTSPRSRSASAKGASPAIVVTSPEGENVPFQILESTRYADGGLKTARIAFVARDVPALGYCDVSRFPAHGIDRDQRSRSPSDGATGAPEVDLENELYRLTLDRATGAITSLLFKAGDWEVLSGPGNVVARQQDRGDLWELYKGLDGGSRVAMTTRQKVPKRGEAVFSDEGKGEPGTVLTGPVFSEFRVARPFGLGPVRDDGSASTTACAGSRSRRGWSISEKYVRYQALFPTTIQRRQEHARDPVRRRSSARRRSSSPRRTGSTTATAADGLALLNIGLPGNLVTDGTMMVSLLRAHTLGAYGFGGGYEPGMSSDSGFQLGQERTMRYALVPHAGDWREAGVFRDGLEFNHPLICRNVLPHAGTLPKRWGLLEVSNPNVVVSSLKPSREGDVALRVYEASGRPAPGVTIKLNATGAVGTRGQPARRRGDRSECRRQLRSVRLASVRDQDDSAAAGCLVRRVARRPPKASPAPT